MPKRPVTYNICVAPRSVTLTQRPEEFVYRSCYAPADLREMMKSAETRSRIRRLPASHLFFGLKELEDEERRSLLPHVTEKQWRGVLDLDLWARDQMSLGQFLYWQKQIVEAADPVARKLVRATDPELWELTFKRCLKIHPRIEDETEEDQKEGEWLQTPDEHYLLFLPKNPEQARLLRALILRLYELDPRWAATLLESCRSRTLMEIEETAYQARTRRTEELGFQDYYDAIEIYTVLPAETPLPEKIRETIREISLMPIQLPKQGDRPLLLFQALADLTQEQEIQPLVEELFYVCNRVLSADRISAADPVRVKKGIGKTISGMNLGLDWWSAGDLSRATEGVRRCYLQSFFQTGYSRLLELQEQARKIESDSHQPAEGSFQETVLQGLLKRYPILAEISNGKIRKRFFRSREDLQRAQEILRQMQPEGNAD